MKPYFFNISSNIGFSLFEEKSLEGLSENNPMYHVVRYSEIEKYISDVFNIGEDGSIFAYNSLNYDEPNNLFELVFTVNADNFLTLVKDHLKKLNPKFNNWAQFARKVLEDGEYKGVVYFLKDADSIYSAINYSYINPPKLRFLVDLNDFSINVKLSNDYGQDYLDVTLDSKEEILEIYNSINELVSSGKYICPELASNLEFVTNFDEIERIMFNL